MQVSQRRFKDWFKTGMYLGLALLFVPMGLGCASTHKTTKTETTVTYPNEAAANRGYLTKTTSSGDQQIETTETTTTTTSDTKTENPGLISSTFHAIGYVIALPFIIVGGLFRMLFGG